MKSQVLLCVTAGLLLAADNPRDDSIKKEKQKLRGTWTITEVIFDGEPLPADIIGKQGLTFTEDRVAFLDKSGKKEKDGAYKIDPSKKPGAIDMPPPPGGPPRKDKDKKKEQVSLAIYSLKDDTLKLCLSFMPGAKRPTKFESKPGSTFMLVTLKRAKP
jgi:uncharacterized protein (TIGR03067 family)